MELSLLSYLNRAQLKIDPFPHFIVENVLPEALYSRLDSSFPESLMLSESDSIVNDRGHTKRLLRRSFDDFEGIDDIWYSFSKVNSGADFFNAIVNFFLATSIDTFYPSLRKQLLNLEVVPRRDLVVHDSGKLLTDFQLVLNKPVNDSFTSRSPHLDNPQQIFALLYYMRKPDDFSVGGGLSLFSPTESALHEQHGRNRSIDEKFLRPRYILPYSSNTLILFLNTRASYHSVQPIYRQNVVRRSVNIIGELPPGSRLFKV